MRRRLVWVLVMALCVGAAALVVGGRGHKITLEPEDNWIVESCPKRAATGETVVVRTCVVSDGDVFCSIDGRQDYGSFTSEGTYEFVMPDHDVTVRTWIEANGLA